LIEKVRDAPKKPGCYLFMDKLGYVIYVGKSKNLHNRVPSYFTAASFVNKRTGELSNRIVDVEYRIMDSELDALLLEYKLIKEYKPWYNSKMKPDRQRPFLRVSIGNGNEATFTSCLEKLDDGAEYFSFFTDEYDLERALSLLCKIWGIPKCMKNSFIRKERPCIYNAVEGCHAPCSEICDNEAYGVAVKDAVGFLKGKATSKSRELRREMAQASGSLEFEKAAYFKELIDGLEWLKAKRQIRYHLPDKGESLVLIRPHQELAFSVFYIKDKQVMHRGDFPQQISDGLIESYLSSLEQEMPAIEECGLLAESLLEVGAYKQFTMLPRKKGSRQAIYNAIIKFSKQASATSK